MCVKKGARKYGFGRVLMTLALKTIHTAKIGYTAFRGYASAAEKHDVLAVADDVLKRAYAHNKISRL